MLAVLTLIFVKEPKRGQMDGALPSNKSDLSFTKTVKKLWALRTYRMMFYGTALGGFASYGFGYWAPTLFVRAFDLTPKIAGARYGGPSFIAGITGAIVLGVLCDRLTSRDSRWPFRLCAIGLVGFGVTMLLLCFTNSVNIATALTLPAGLMAGGWVIAMQSALQDLLPSKMRATGSALWAFGLTFVGLAIGVQGVGVANDFFTAQFGNDAIRYSMALTLLATFPAALCILAAGKTMDEDRVEIAAVVEGDALA